MENILDRILATKRDEVAQAQRQRPLAQMRRDAEQRRDVRDFVAAIRSKLDQHRPAVIAEIKKASPSRACCATTSIPRGSSRLCGEWRGMPFGVDRFTVLSRLVARSCRHTLISGLPALRKDFIVDGYQIFEARASDADAILLIVAALSDAELIDYEAIAAALGMAVLVEVHDAAELRRALRLKTPLIGINNRNLRSFETSLQTTLDLLPQMPSGRIVVTESGILTDSDVARMRAAGVHVFLVGEALMRSQNPGSELARLFA